MKSRDNLDKIRGLCISLADRDRQLKIYASALWVILERVDSTTALVNQILKNSECTETAQNMLADVLSNLGEITELAANRGCKRIYSDV